MARNDGIDRTFARNQDLPTLDDVAKVQEHNEREKDNYSNQDIDTTQTHRNIHFKTPTDSYAAMFDQMIADGVISTRGLKADAVKYGELIFDVNSAYFHNHGGYEYAKQFYTDAYKAAVEIVGGEQYILSAVMHADERNRAMSEALGQDVYHYHLHVVYVPVVEKQILWSKRCKDKSLVGTVKETIMQVSRSKKWESKYKAAVEIVGGEQYILSAVMHADERNRAMSEALGQDVYHYHLHVVYVPVVEKQILWSKRCKDKSLVGTVKETIMQVSRSKKWESKVALDEQGHPLLTAKGKKVLRASYSVLQDDFFNYMKAAGYTDVERGERGSTEEHLTVTQFKVAQEVLRASYSVLQDDFFNYMKAAGYTDVERGERGSTEEHLTVTQFKVAQEKQRLETMTAQIAQTEQTLNNTQAVIEKKEKELQSLQKQAKEQHAAALTVQEIRSMGKKTITGNVSFTPSECNILKDYAVTGLLVKAENSRLEEKLRSAQWSAAIWKQRYDALYNAYQELKKEVQPYLDAVKLAPEKVRAFFDELLTRTRQARQPTKPIRRKQDMER